MVGSTQNDSKVSFLAGVVTWLGNLKVMQSSGSSRFWGEKSQHAQPHSKSKSSQFIRFQKNTIFIIIHQYSLFLVAPSSFVGGHGWNKHTSGKNLGKLERRTAKQNCDGLWSLDGRCMVAGCAGSRNCITHAFFVQLCYIYMLIWVGKGCEMFWSLNVCPQTKQLERPYVQITSKMH